MKMMRMIPSQLWRLVRQTLRHYFMAKGSVQRNVIRSIWIKGRYGKDYVFQLSHGTQQIKRYEPKKYKNNVNTPLRIRARNIMRMAVEEPFPTKKEKLRELYRTYPFHLPKEETVKLRLLNFYFDEKGVRKGDLVKIWKKGEEQALEELDTKNQAQDELVTYKQKEGIDVLFWEGVYARKKAVGFEWNGEDEDKYYAVNERNGEVSNVVRIFWG